MNSFKRFIVKFNFSLLWVSLLVFVLDLFSKWHVQLCVAEGQKIYLIPKFLSVTLSHNMGASWGLGSSGAVGIRIMWIAISVLMSAFILWFYLNKLKKNPNSLKTSYKVALTLMLGGAVGNMIDRIFYWKAIVGFDGVIDWISFEFGSYQFPYFNLADSALVIGVAIIIVKMIIEMIQESIQKGKNGGYKLPPKEYEKILKEKEDEKHKNN